MEREALLQRAVRDEALQIAKADVLRESVRKETAKRAKKKAKRRKRRALKRGKRH